MEEYFVLITYVIIFLMNFIMVFCLNSNQIESYHVKHVIDWPIKLEYPTISLYYSCTKTFLLISCSSIVLKFYGCLHNALRSIHKLCVIVYICLHMHSLVRVPVLLIYHAFSYPGKALGTHRGAGNGHGL